MSFTHRRLPESGVTLGKVENAPKKKVKTQAQENLASLEDQLQNLVNFHSVWLEASAEILSLTTGAVTPSMIEARENLAQIMQRKSEAMLGIWQEYDRLEKTLRGYREVEIF